MDGRKLRLKGKGFFIILEMPPARGRGARRRESKAIFGLRSPSLGLALHLMNIGNFNFEY